MNDPSTRSLGIEDQSVRAFLDAVAARQPTPGGGAVASIVAALAAALGGMVVNYSRGKKSLVEHAALLAEADKSLSELGQRAIRLAEDDASAYARVNSLMRLDSNDPARLSQFAEAVEQAVKAPHSVLHAAMETLRLLARLAGATNPMLGSDLAMAAILAEAAAKSAAWNVRVNLPLLGDPSVRQAFETTLARSLADAAQIAQSIQEAVTRALPA